MEYIGNVLGVIIAFGTGAYIFFKQYDNSMDVVQNLLRALIVTSIILALLFGALVVMTEYWFISSVVIGLIVAAKFGQEMGIKAGIISMVVLLIVGTMIPPDAKFLSKKDKVETHNYSYQSESKRKRQHEDDESSQQEEARRQREENERRQREEELRQENESKEQEKEVKIRTETVQKNSEEPVEETFDQLLGFSTPPGKHWIQAKNNGAYLWNPSPSEGETVEWSGSYIQDGQYRLADGSGTITWYNRNGKVVQIDEGTLARGQRNGQIKHQFVSSGKVEYINYNHGRIPAPANSITNADIFVGNSPSTGYDCYIMKNTMQKLPQSNDTFFLTLKMITPAGEIKYLNYEFNLNGNFKSDHYSTKASVETPIEWNIWQVLRKLS